MVKCSFCGNEYNEQLQGVTVVDVFNKIYHYCSSKCRKNFNLGRDKRRVRWTQNIKKGK